MKKLLLSSLILMFGLVLIACDNDDNGANEEPTEAEMTEAPTEAAAEGVYGLGDTFQFEGSSGLVELTFGTGITFTTVENQFSDLDGEDVIVIPVTMTNVGDDTGSLNMFDITVFGSAGVSLESVDTFFMDDDIRWGSDLRSGASLDSYLHILYDGDGEYIIEFSAGFGLGDTVELVFQVQK